MVDLGRIQELGELQSCQFHLLHNAMQHAAEDDLKREVVADVQGVLNAPDLPAAHVSGCSTSLANMKSGAKARRLARGECAGKSDGNASAADASEIDYANQHVGATPSRA